MRGQSLAHTSGQPCAICFCSFVLKAADVGSIEYMTSVGACDESAAAKTGFNGHAPFPKVATSGGAIFTPVFVVYGLYGESLRKYTMTWAREKYGCAVRGCNHAGALRRGRHGPDVLALPGARPDGAGQGPVPCS